MSEVTFKVVGGTSQWGFSTDPDGNDARVFPSGVEHTEEFSDAELKLLEAAHAAGYIEYTGDTVAVETGHVESQEDSEAAYAQAQADGTWQEGNAQQYELDVASGARVRQEEYLAQPELYDGEESA